MLDVLLPSSFDLLPVLRVPVHELGPVNTCLHLVTLLDVLLEIFRIPQDRLSTLLADVIRLLDEGLIFKGSEISGILISMLLAQVIEKRHFSTHFRFVWAQHAAIDALSGPGAKLLDLLTANFVLLIGHQVFCSVVFNGQVVFGI